MQSQRPEERKRKTMRKVKLSHFVLAFLLLFVLVDDQQEEQMEVEVKESEKTLADDGVFKVTLGPSKSTTDDPAMQKTNAPNLFQPARRMNCGLAVKRGCLYLYGGMFEDGDKQVTYSDMYSLDLKKLDEWKVIITDDTSNQEWLGSESENESEEGDTSDSEDSEEDVEKMET